MSTYCKDEQMCSVCGTKNSVMVLGSTNACGASDLDTRPPEMERTDALYNVQKCKKCGFVAYDLSRETKIKQAFLNSINYKECDQKEFVSEFSKMFYKMHLISLEEGQYLNAYWYLLKCAWSVDDVNDTNNSIEIRKKCLQLFDTLNKEEYEPQLNLIKLDLLRRSKQFDECMEFIKKLKGNREILGAIYEKTPKDIVDKIIKLQEKLCIDKDDRCYDIEGQISKPGCPGWYLEHTTIIEKSKGDDDVDWINW